MSIKLRNGQSALLLLCLVCIGALAPQAHAANCTTQAQMTPADRSALANAARAMVAQVQNGDVQGLKASTLPAVAADFSGIAASVQSLQPLVHSATITVDALYDLDASGEAQGAAQTQFFCGSPVVVLTFANLPPGKYALAVVHATGVQQPQQVALILAQNLPTQWMLAGINAKPMIEAGHDGLWYWVSARKYAQMNGKWVAFFYYRLAADLLDPLDNLSSPNLQKLQHESDEVRPTDFPGDKPVTFNANGSVFQVTAIDTSTAFGGLDLDVHYTPDPSQASQLRDPPSARQQVVGVMTALLTAHPELHSAFHGIWVHADQGNASLFALELPMDQISGGTTAPVVR
jgi:hypothetical protein